MSQLSRLEKHAIVLSLADNLKNAGSWCGETHVQKAVYFLQAVTQVPLGFDFILYKHGPFSFDLRDALTAMRADHQLRIRANPIPYGPTLVTTESGKKLQKRLASSVGKYRNGIDFVADHFGPKTVTELERLGTALYVSMEDDSRSQAQVAQRVHQLKSHIPLDVATEAAVGVGEIVAEYNASN